MALDPLWLLAASSKFPDTAHVPMALDVLCLLPDSSEFLDGTRHSIAVAYEQCT